MMNKTLLVVLFVSAIAIEQTFAHSYVTSPTSRSDQRSTQTGCRGPSCMGPCDARASAARTPIRVQRGSSLTVNWPRNNHAAGFIRWAWAPTAQSDSHAAFDNNVQLYSCHETGKVAGGACAPANAALPNGGDAGPPDGSTGACTRSFNVPSHLPDGRWTLQWAWFGGAFNLGDYYSCIDYEIVGGSPVAAKQPVQFDGGDFSNPTATGSNGKCKFYNTRKLHTCTSEPCFNGEMNGPNAGGRPAAMDGQPNQPAPATPAPATPAPATPKPATPAPATPAPAPATPAPVPAPGAGAGSCAVGGSCPDFLIATAVTDKWASGMTGVVRASARRAMPSWQLSFRVPAGMRVSGVWNAQLVGSSVNSDGSGTVTVRNPAWQTNVNAGQLIEIGFTASFNSGSPVAATNGFAFAARADDEHNDADEAHAASQNHGKKNLETGAIVGIAVGGAAGVAALVAGALIARKKLKGEKRTPGPEDILFSNVAQESPAVNPN